MDPESQDVSRTEETQPGKKTFVESLEGLCSSLSDAFKANPLMKSDPLKALWREGLLTPQGITNLAGKISRHEYVPRGRRMAVKAVLTAALRGCDEAVVKDENVK